MIQDNPDDMKLITKAIVAVLILIILWLLHGYEEAEKKNHALMDSLEQLEEAFQAERDSAEVRIQDLQQEIDLQQKRNGDLKSELLSLEERKRTINRNSNEEKADIRGRTDADSLRNAVARQYR